MILIGAHYDSTGEKKGSKAPPTTGPASPPCWRLPRHSRRDPALHGALRLLRRRGNGLNGSKAYAASLDTDAVAKLLAMVNYDTIAGVTSSMSTRPTRRGRVQLHRPEPLQFDPKVRDRLLAISQQTATPVRHPPSYSGYPEGETGSWSDHAPLPAWGAHRLRGGQINHHQRGRWL